MAVPSLATEELYFESALQAARWIEASVTPTKDGVVWPADPTDPNSVSTTLYAGTAGPILFFLELYRHTGDRRYLELARAGADELLASLSKDQDTGLYIGIAGCGFTLGRAYLTTSDRRYREGSLACVNLLKRRAQKAGRGVQWNDLTDIVSGGAGTGLFLLWVAEKLHTPDALELAVQGGERLLELGQERRAGELMWMMSPAEPEEMPNFSHGTAGVAYFLATLFQQTGEKKFLNAAFGGARYLLSIAHDENDGCLIYHDSTPAGIGLYYLGWCHGPPGTARLFYRLSQVTKNPQWMKWVNRGAVAMIANGSPERIVTAGEWNNVGLCCGVSSAADFFLSLYRITGVSQYLASAHQAAMVLLSRATRDEKGMRWIQAEHRIQPELLVAQSGYMQGASGIGLWLLRLSAVDRGEERGGLRLPDNPFPY